MKRWIPLFLVILSIVGAATIGNASTVGLYLDTAPNLYAGTSGWPAFRDATYQSIYDGTFVSQAHSANPANIGTLNYEVEDYMVYSFNPYGKRLHAFYYIEGETTSTLAGRFQVSMQYEYDGIWYNPYEEVGWGEWVTPGSWINYDGNSDGVTDGVMGSMGNASWGAYGVNTQAALDADILEARRSLGNTRFMARLDGEVSELVAEHTPVPEPGTWTLLISGLAGLGLLRLRKK